MLHVFRMKSLPYGNVSRAASGGKRNAGCAHYHKPVDTTSLFVVTKDCLSSIVLMKNHLIGGGLGPQKLL